MSCMKKCNLSLAACKPVSCLLCLHKAVTSCPVCSETQGLCSLSLWVSWGTYSLDCFFTDTLQKNVNASAQDNCVGDYVWNSKNDWRFRDTWTWPCPEKTSTHLSNSPCSFLASTKISTMNFCICENTPNSWNQYFWHRPVWMSGCSLLP